MVSPLQSQALAPIAIGTERGDAHGSLSSIWRNPAKAPRICSELSRPRFVRKSKAPLPPGVPYSQKKGAMVFGAISECLHRDWPQVGLVVTICDRTTSSIQTLLGSTAGPGIASSATFCCLGKRGEAIDPNLDFQTDPLPFVPCESVGMVACTQPSP